MTFQVYLPDAEWLHVFPSPVKGWLQVQLKDPTVFVHEAELWQSCRPLTHSSISISVKEKNKVLRLVLVIFCLFVYFESFRFVFFFSLPFPQVRYYPYNKMVEQITLYKVRKVVRVLSDFVVATYEFLNRFQLFNWRITQSTGKITTLNFTRI